MRQELKVWNFALIENGVSTLSNNEIQFIENEMKNLENALRCLVNFESFSYMMWERKYYWTLTFL